MTNNHVKIIPLGGLEEIGKNMTVIQYKEEIYIIDVGLKFPDEDMHGVDIIVPDFDYLRKNKHKIKKMFVTHAHEDHIGGIPSFLEEFDVPIYTTKLTSELIKKKLKGKKHRFHIVKEDTVVKGDACQISFFRTNHSIPESLGIVIETPLGSIVHTGDFKFDLTPIDKKPTDFGRLSAIGDKGVLALLSDSTNATKPGISISEETVKHNLLGRIRECKGRVVVATFASSLHRVPALFDIAKELNRKVLVFGRSMEDNIKIATRIGLIQNHEGVLITSKEMKQYRPEELLIVTTGAQGEEMAGLNRMANGTHRNVTLVEGDTIVFSSSVIPGNEKAVGKLTNGLLKNGVTSIQEPGLHTSGHGQQEEQKIMLQLMRPTYFIPVHGEYRMLLKHRELAVGIGVKEENVILCENGTIVEIDEKKATVAGKIQANDVYLDNSGMGEVSYATLRDRQRMATHGMAIVDAMYDTKVENQVSVRVRIFGVVAKYDRFLIQKEIKAVIEKGTAEIQDFYKLKHELYAEIGTILHKHIKRRPMISLSLSNYKKRGTNKKG